MHSRLAAHVESRQLLDTKGRYRSSDGSDRVVFEVHGTQVRFDTVVLRLRNRYSLCLSCQSGCPLNCIFCDTGGMPRFHQLSTEVIVSQALNALATIPILPASRYLEFSFMGMGEPMLNYRNLRSAILELHALFVQARFMISTVGHRRNVRRLSKELPFVDLQLSLHSVSDGVRQTIVPDRGALRVDEVFECAQIYSNATGRLVHINYVILLGINDSPNDAEELARRLTDLNVCVRLAHLSPSRAASCRGIEAAPHATIQRFADVLSCHGISNYIFTSAGTTQSSGCGQLA